MEDFEYSLTEWSVIGKFESFLSGRTDAWVCDPLFVVVLRLDWCASSLRNAENRTRCIYAIVFVEMRSVSFDLVTVGLTHTQLGEIPEESLSRLSSGQLCYAFRLKW